MSDSIVDRPRKEGISFYFIERLKRIYRESRKIENFVVDLILGIGPPIKVDKSLLIKLRDNIFDFDDILWSICERVGYEPNGIEANSTAEGIGYKNIEDLSIGIKEEKREKEEEDVKEDIEYKNIEDLSMGIKNVQKILKYTKIPPELTTMVTSARTKLAEVSDTFRDVMIAEGKEGNDGEASEKERKQYQDGLERESKLLILKMIYIFIGLIMRCDPDNPWTREWRKRGIKAGDINKLYEMALKGSIDIIDQSSEKEWNEMKTEWKKEEDIPLSYFVSQLTVLERRWKRIMKKYEAGRRERRIDKKEMKKLETLRNGYYSVKEMKEKAIEIEEGAKDESDIVVERLYKSR